MQGCPAPPAGAGIVGGQIQHHEQLPPASFSCPGPGSWVQCRAAMLFLCTGEAWPLLCIAGQFPPSYPVG